MAGGDYGSSSRETTEDQTEEESAHYQFMFKHFRENKVEIASAITKPFPFLMSLRDRGFITEHKFQESQERCQNLVPVDRVVYDILSDLQKKFHLSLLEIIFSTTHLKAYPDLRETLRNFRNVSHNYKTLQRMNGREAEERPSLPAVREASCSPGHSQMNDEQAEKVPSLPQCIGGEGSSFYEQMFDGQEPQNDLSGQEPQDDLSGQEPQDDLSGQEPQDELSGQEPQDDLSGQEPQDELSSSVLRPTAEAEQSTSENETCSCVMCSPAYMPEDPEARMEISQADTMETGNNTIVRKHIRKRKKKKNHNWSRVKQRRSQTVQPTNNSGAAGQATLRRKKMRKNPGCSAGQAALRRKKMRKNPGCSAGQAALRRKKMRKNPGCSAKTRVPRKHRNEKADFSAELLPVTCGDVKGVLHKDKFKQGISVQSIQAEDGDWYTPSEFEILGDHGRWKNWKLSLRCYHWPLKLLIQRNFLPNPPRTYGRKKKRTQSLYRSSANSRNSDECEVCQDGGTLFCCDTCSRAFHENCHIPTVEAEITPWSCIFCRVQSLGSQETHPESEILQRQMVPQEQLKCEFVLLRVYCCPESSFFSKMPYYCYFRETSEGVHEPMWLDIIKKKLCEQGYSHVEEFVQDMRLIFQNHRTTFKDLNFGQMGLRLEFEFEKNFKEVFAIQETSENS